VSIPARGPDAEHVAGDRRAQRMNDAFSPRANRTEHVPRLHELKDAGEAMNGILTRMVNRLLSQAWEKWQAEYAAEQEQRFRMAGNAHLGCKQQSKRFHPLLLFCRGNQAHDEPSTLYGIARVSIRVQGVG
jgi:hypothetical protein